MQTDSTGSAVASSASLPRTPLLHLPSPLEPAPRLGAAIGAPRLYVKRDDEGGRGGGGNKLRKFERQFADAIASGADTLVLAGHPQSNAARELVGAAARFGLGTVIVSKDLIDRPTTAFEQSGNALLMSLMDARFVTLGPDDDFGEGLDRAADELRQEGARPYVLPFGATNVLGVLGYAECADEIIDQSVAAEGRAPDVVAVAAGSGGTQAGLVAGFRRRGVATRVLGFSILPDPDDARETVAALATEALALDGLGPVAPSDVAVDARARGAGYGAVTDGALDAIRLAARLEGLLLDPVYTGKVLDGLRGHLAEEPVSADSIVVLVHTGGLPLLYAYADAFNTP